MSISVPRDLKEYVKKRTREAHYGTPSDYMRSLVREDMRRADQERLEQELLKGIRSGPGKVMTPHEWAKLKTEVVQHITSKKHVRS